MKIEIIPKLGSLDRLNVLLDGEVWKEVHPAIFGRKTRFIAIVDEADLFSKFNAYEFQRVRNYVIWRLSKQNYHSQEVSRLLKERLASQSTIQKVMQEFIEKGFFNDQLWVESFIRTQRKRLALPAILQKMKLKGLSQEEIESVRKTWQDVDQEKLSIENLLRTRYRKKNLEEFSEKQKVIKALLRKGFSFENIKQVLDGFHS